MSSVLAAFARSQLRRLDGYTAQVRQGAGQLTKVLAELPGVEPPAVPADRTHVYHHFRVGVRPEEVGSDLPAGLFRQVVQDALAAEGVPVGSYQTRPLPGQVLFRRGVGYGQGCPWTCRHTGGGAPPSYDPADYPATLDVIRSTFVVGHRLCMASFRDPGTVERYADAFGKVMSNLDELHRYAKTVTYVEPWEEGDRLW
jgi:hypothetical protein